MKQMRAAILSISDTRMAENDLAGDALEAELVSMNASIVERLLVRDDLLQIRETIAALADREDIELLITTGGTGLSPRDNTPEATLSVIEREAPGIAEAMRRETSQKTPYAMLSRGVCGIRGTTLIINLPGSPKAVVECFAVVRPILEHAVAQLAAAGHD